MRVKAVDYARFFANVLIVIYHAHVGALGGRVAWGIGMALLCLISGWCCFRDFEREGNLAVWWRVKVAHRVKRLLVPYLLWGMMFVALYAALAPTNADAARRIAEAGVDGMWGAAKAVFNFTDYVLYGPLWFLRMLFAAGLLSYVWGSLFRRVGTSLGLAAALVTGGAAQAGLAICGVHGYGTFAFVLFGIGAWAGAYGIGIRNLQGLCSRRAFTGSKWVETWMLPTGMFVYILHLAVLRIWPNVFAGILLPMVIWHVLRRVCPTVLKVLEGRG